MKTRPSVLERFLAAFTPEPNSGCFLWDLSLQKNGYARFNERHGKATTGHRMAWRLFRGEIPAGLQVCHKCDVRFCVNPDHLYLAPAVVNIEHAVDRGRLRKSRKGLPHGVEMRKGRFVGRFMYRGKRYGVGGHATALAATEAVQARRLEAKAAERGA